MWTNAYMVIFALPAPFIATHSRAASTTPARCGIGSRLGATLEVFIIVERSFVLGLLLLSPRVGHWFRLYSICSSKLAKIRRATGVRRWAWIRHHVGAIALEGTHARERVTLRPTRMMLLRCEIGLSQIRECLGCVFLEVALFCELEVEKRQRCLIDRRCHGTQARWENVIWP